MFNKKEKFDTSKKKMNLKLKIIKKWFLYIGKN